MYNGLVALNAILHRPCCAPCPIGESDKISIIYTSSHRLLHVYTASMLFWLALLYSYQHTINAAPTPIGPAVHPILSHISSPSSGNTSNGCPNLRSTWDIVWNCLATIFACAWVSVHPNIPPPGTKEWQVAIMRSELMIWTIIAPEMMLFWAIRQWVGARKLAALYKGVFEFPSLSELPRTRVTLIG